MVTITIDGKPVEVAEDTTILKAAEKAGIWIPTMCHSDYFEPYGVCRLCSVEVVRGKRSRIVTACNFPVRGGMTVHTSSGKVKWIRKLIMELMLSRWPNVRVVKEMAGRLGIGTPRFISLERDEAEDACILCGMCVNMCNEVVKAGVLGFAHTGIKREVVLPFNERSDRCIVCGACAHVCPTGHIRMVVEDYRGKKPEFTLGPKTPIYVPTLQAVPRVPVIDTGSCIHFATGACETCAKVCEPNAINYAMQDETVEIEVGQILLATGFDLFDASAMAQYGYGRLDNVYSSLEFESLLNSTGPTGGKVLTKAGKEPRSVAIIHCIGSRDTNHHPYCSRVCCMYALKFAHLVRDRTSAEIYQFYIDMRAFGKGYEEFYSRLLERKWRAVAQSALRRHADRPIPRDSGGYGHSLQCDGTAKRQRCHTTAVLCQQEPGWLLPRTASQARPHSDLHRRRVHRRMRSGAEGHPGHRCTGKLRCGAHALADLQGGSRDRAGPCDGAGGVLQRVQDVQRPLSLRRHRVPRREEGLTCQ
jgi:heterodisulfide reductase subunit A